MIAPIANRYPRSNRTLTLHHSSSTKPQRLFWANPARYRFFVGGVGSGKTRAGCVEILRQPPGTTGMVLAPTYPMLRDATLRTFMRLVHKGGILKSWNKAEMTVELTDNKTVMFRSADNPDRLRGPNIGWFYLDEAAMMSLETWLIMIGRLRERPGKAWATSTPRGMNWLHKIFQSGPDYQMIRSSTRDNPYLPPEFIRSLEGSYSARRLRQEVEGEFLEDVEGALWTYELIDRHRVKEAPTDLREVVVAIDPAVSSGEDSDETGIVVCALGDDMHGYVLADLSGRYTPNQWAKKAVAAYHEFKADRIIGEANNGGDLVESNIRQTEDGKHLSFKKVIATRGKYTRAEPISTRYDSSQVHHVGTFSALEDQMCQWVQGDKSPDRLDALVYALTHLMPGKRMISVA